MQISQKCMHMDLEIHFDLILILSIIRCILVMWDGMIQRRLILAYQEEIMDGHAEKDERHSLIMIV